MNHTGSYQKQVKCEGELYMQSYFCSEAQCWKEPWRWNKSLACCIWLTAPRIAFWLVALIYLITKHYLTVRMSFQIWLKENHQFVAQHCMWQILHVTGVWNRNHKEGPFLLWFHSWFLHKHLSPYCLWDSAYHSVCQVQHDNVKVSELATKAHFHP